MKPTRTPVASAAATLMNSKPMQHHHAQFTGEFDRPAGAPAANDPPAWDVATQLAAVGARSAETEVEESQQRSRKGKISTASRAGEVDLEQDGGPEDSENSPLRTMDGTSLEQRKLARTTLELRTLVGERIRFARETFGLNQQQFAAAIGHVKSTQPSLWEKSHRLPPITELPNIARALGCSVDFLLGVSEEMEHDAGESRRALLVGHLRDQLEAVAGHLADATLESGVEVEAAMRSTKLLTRCQGMAAAIERFRVKNVEVFDDMPAGSVLVHAARELAEAAAAVGGALDGVVLRRERAALQAKQVMAGGGS